MKKKLYIILGVFVGLLLAAYLILIFFVGSFVTSAVNRYGPELTQTPVKLTAAHISPLSGEGTLDVLTVGNPPGWKAQNAFSLKRIHISVVPSSLFTDHIIIKDLEIDDPEFDYETRVVTSNIGELVSRIEGQKNNQAAQAKSKSGTPLRFEIQHLLIKGGKLTVVVANTAAVPLTMPPIEFHDLGTGQGGVTSSELAALVGRTLLTSIVQASSKAVGKVVPAADNLLKNATSQLQGLFHH